MSKQWKCPECGGNKLVFRSWYHEKEWYCVSGTCQALYRTGTIQALTKFEAFDTFTTSPPGFQMPWENQVLVNQEDYDTYAKLLLNIPAKCDCGGEKTGGAHSTWCSKEAK